MLVLSRRVDEELVFPNLDIRIKVLRNEGNRVRLGVDAPGFIEVARAERVSESNPKDQLIPDLSHEIRNQLNSVRLALELYERQSDRGDIDGANRTFLRMIAQLRQADLDKSISPPLSSSPSVNNPKVLLVDDDANERELLAGLLQMDGCQVDTAIDGQDAIGVLQRGAKPDVVLLDMQMPRIGGKETLLAIRENWRNLLVFGVSGSTASENDIQIGGPHGIDEWFEKPLNPYRLIAKLRQTVKCSSGISV